MIVCITCYMVKEEGVGATLALDPAPSLVPTLLHISGVIRPSFEELKTSYTF